MDLRGPQKMKENGDESLVNDDQHQLGRVLGLHRWKGRKSLPRSLLDCLHQTKKLLEFHDQEKEKEYALTNKSGKQIEE